MPITREITIFELSLDLKSDMTHYPSLALLPNQHFTNAIMLHIADDTRRFHRFD